MKVVAFLCICALFSPGICYFSRLQDMSLLECWLCVSHGTAAVAPFGHLAHSMSASCRASGRRRDREGAGLKSCGEESDLPKR